MTRRALYPLILAAAAIVTACEISVDIPDPQLDEIAQTVSTVGHPLAEYKGARFVGGSAGGCMSESGGKYVDVAIDYSPALSKHTRTMNVRFHVHGTDPCEVTTEVLSDDGPAPILLDNEIASPAVGQMVCDALAAQVQ